MELDHPSPEVKRAIEGAVAWFDAAKIEGMQSRTGCATTT